MELISDETNTNTQTAQPAPASAFKACIITSTEPAILTKTREYDPKADAIISRPGGHMSKGTAQNVTFNNMAEFAQFLDTAKTNQALAASIHNGPADTVEVLSEKEYRRAGEPAGSITRTKEHFIREPKQPGLLILDCDDKSITKDHFIKTIKKVIDLENVAHAYTTSSSSWLYVNGELKQGDTGKRLYIVIDDASDTKRAGGVLFDRLWLEGAGYYLVSAAGSLLDRGIIDTAMFSDSCRLDFVSGSNCIAPVTQKRPPAEYQEGRPLNTAEALPSLNKTDRDRLAAIKGSARAALESQAAKAKKDYCRRKSLEHLAKQGIKQPTADQLEQAKNNVLKALESDSLTGDFIITLAKNGERVSIADVLRDPNYYDRAKTLDPIEPEYNNGAAVGMLFLDSGMPQLYSFAHGGKTYKLFKQSRFIQHEQGRTAETTNKTLEFIRTLPHIFDLGAQMVQVYKGRVLPFDKHTLQYELGNNAQFYIEKADKDGNSITAYTEPPRDVVEQILAMNGQGADGLTRRGLNPLKAVITAPTITPDGYIVYKRGYDRKTGLYLSMDYDLEAPPERVTPDALSQAYDEVMAVIDTFNLNSALDKSVVLSAFLTAVTRPAIDKAPIYALDAPSQGSGKTYLAECIATLATGQAAPITPAIQGNEAEIQKTLLSMLMNNERVIIWDNVIGTFNSATLAAFVTANTYGGRVLGASSYIELPNKSMLVITGNNLNLYGDLPRRCVTARIDTGEENPLNTRRDLSALNGHKPDLYIKANRQRLAMACITIVRAYITSFDHLADGKITDTKTASFEQWDVMARQPLVYLARLGVAPDLEDIKQSIDSNMTADPEKAALSELLEALQQWRGSEGFTSKQLYDYAFSTFTPGEDADTRETVAELLRDICRRDKQITSRGIGKQLLYKKGRIAGGRRLNVETLPSNRGNLFTVENV